MSFPTTSTLTTFTGADENPLSEGGNWASPVQPALFPLERFSNAASSNVNPGQSYWTPSNFGPNTEVWIQSVVGIANFGVNHGYAVLGRIQSPNDPVLAAMYYVQWNTPLGGSFDGYSMWRMTDGGDTFTQLGATYTGHTAADGEGLGLEILGSGATVTLNSYYRSTGGVWLPLFSRTDSDAARIVASGKIGLGLEIDAEQASADVFGGGTQVSSTDILVPMSPTGALRS